LIEFVSHEEFLNLSHQRTDTPFMPRNFVMEEFSGKGADRRKGLVYYELDGPQTRRRYQKDFPSLTGIRPEAPLIAKVIDDRYLEYVAEPYRDLAKNGIFIDSRGFFSSYTEVSDATLDRICEYAAAIKDCELTLFLASVHELKHISRPLSYFEFALTIALRGKSVTEVKNRIKNEKEKESQSGGFFSFFSLANVIETATSFFVNSGDGDESQRVEINAWDNTVFVITRIDEVNNDDNMGDAFWYEFGCEVKHGLSKIPPMTFDKSIYRIFVDGKSRGRELSNEMMRKNNLNQLVDRIIQEEQASKIGFFNRKRDYMLDSLNSAQKQCRNFGLLKGWGSTKAIEKIRVDVEQIVV